MELLVAVAVLILIDVAVWRWGVDSRIWVEDDRAIQRRPRRAI
jgi:hypothetical protein